MIDFHYHFRRFFSQVASGVTEIYNEFSLQHEIGIHLRSALPTDFKVQFERPYSFFELGQSVFEKKEIDISVFRPDHSVKYAIELKYPRSGQYPEQMFKACQDIRFLEQLCAASFEKCFFVMVADDTVFYNRKLKTGGVYQYFRADVPIHRIIQKPTGAKDRSCEIRGSYRIIWKDISQGAKYTVVEVSR